jgi:hypothetical protein
MTQDQPSPFGTPPADPGTGEPEKHRSVADGELAAPWSLRDFFGSLNSVMRLPSKARRKAETKTGGGIAFALPGIRPWMSKLVLYGGGLTAAFMLVVRPIVGWATDSGHASLRPVVGVWEAGKGKYQGRRFEMTDSAVVFHTGQSATDYTWHRVQEVRVRRVADSTLYTVRYEEGKRTADMTFWYYGGGTPVIRLKNQPAVIWNKTNLVPSSGPPPAPPPRI